MKSLIALTVFLTAGPVGCFCLEGFIGSSVIVFSRVMWKPNMNIHICYPHECIDGKFHSDKISLYECKNTMWNLAILIKNIKTQDRGRYTFMVDNFKWQATLHVYNASCCVGTKTVTQEKQATVHITCDYPGELRMTTKYFIKLKGHSVDKVIYVNSGSSYSQSSHYYISEEHQTKTFSLRITDVREEDGGIYYCGAMKTDSSINYLLILNTIHLRVAEKVGSAKVTGFLGGHVMMMCHHPLQKGQARFICKESGGGCPERKQAKVQNEWHQSEGFSLYNDSTSGVLIIRDLAEGSYRCGVEISEFNEQYTKVMMEMKDDPCCGSNTSQVGRIGETVTITCQYPDIFEASPKHLCLEDENQLCHDISWLKAVGTYAILSNGQANVFTVTINNLRLGDAGVYWCGAETNDGNITYVSRINKVHVTITSNKVIAHEDDLVEITCPFASKYKQNLKHFCKEGECLPEQHNLHTESKDTTDAFNVTINHVTAENAGKYWCGIKRGETVMNYLSTELHVIMKEVINMTGHETHSVSIECRYHRESVENQLTFCMGEQISSCEKVGVESRNERLSLTQNAPAGVFTVTIADLKQDDSGIYWCGEGRFGSFIYTKVYLQVLKAPGSSLTITVGICVTLLLIVICGFTLMLFTLKNTQGSSSFNRAERRNSDVPIAVCHYEEINPARCSSQLNMEVHQTASSSPNSPADYETICYTVQLMTSDVPEPTYTTVSFHKYSDSTIDAVAFTEEE